MYLTNPPEDYKPKQKQNQTKIAQEQNKRRRGKRQSWGPGWQFLQYFSMRHERRLLLAKNGTPCRVFRCSTTSRVRVFKLRARVGIQITITRAFFCAGLGNCLVTTTMSADRHSFPGRVTYIQPSRLRCFVTWTRSTPGLLSRIGIGKIGMILFL